MKIGELSHRSGISASAIRLYIQEGLLLPEHSGFQYNFSERDYEDLKVILKMKQQQFSLKEIQSYLSLFRLSNFVEPETIDACLRMMENKKQDLRNQVTILTQVIEEIDLQIQSLENHIQKSTKRIGVPLAALHLLACPDCGSPLHLTDAELDGQYIYRGNISCSCGYQARIEDGILDTGNRYEGAYDRPDLTRGVYRDVGQKFSIAMQKSQDFIASKMRTKNMSGKVLLESNINGCFYLYTHLNLIPDDCICIITDKFPETLKMYRSLIEMLNINKQILFIADAHDRYPLRKNCIDLHVSFYGENEFSLYHEKSFISTIQPLLKSDAVIWGAFSEIPLNSKSQRNLRVKYPESNRYCYDSAYLKKEYLKNGHAITLTIMGTVTHTSQDYSFECHVDGEVLTMYCFYTE